MASARSYALNLLKRRLRSTKELQEALRRRGVEQDEIEALTQELTTVDLLNDERFAKAFAHYRDVTAPRGARRLRLELREKGIAVEIIDKVLAERRNEQEEGEQPNEETQIRYLIERRERVYQNLDSVTRKRRLFAFLLRRGFAPETVRRILDS